MPAILECHWVSPDLHVNIDELDQNQARVISSLSNGQLLRETYLS